MPDDTKPRTPRASNPGRRRLKDKPADAPAAPDSTPEVVVEAEPTAAPKLTGSYKAVTCLKYMSARGKGIIDAKPNDVLTDLSDQDIARFRKSGSIELNIEG